jgi:hypothetical protein
VVADMHMPWEGGDSRDSLGATAQGQDVSCSVMCHGHAAHPASGLGLAGRGLLPGQKVAAIAGHPSGQLQHQSSEQGRVTGVRRLLFQSWYQACAGTASFVV